MTPLEQQEHRLLSLSPEEEGQALRTCPDAERGASREIGVLQLVLFLTLNFTFFHFFIATWVD